MEGGCRAHEGGRDDQMLVGNGGAMEGDDGILYRDPVTEVQIDRNDIKRNQV